MMRTWLWSSTAYRVRGVYGSVRRNQYISSSFTIAGLISNEQAGAVIEIFERLNGKVHQIGCGLNSAFMTMSFMALLVIPKLKISDKGLFDVSEFKLTVIEKDT